jgi:hypothetical protein
MEKLQKSDLVQDLSFSTDDEMPMPATHDQLPGTNTWQRDGVSRRQGSSSKASAMEVVEALTQQRQ